MKRILLLGYLSITGLIGYGQVEEIYTLDNHSRISSVQYPDSLIIKRSFDSVGNIKTFQIINPCFDRPIPKITTSGSTTFCQGGSVTLTAPTSLRYKWSNGDTTKSIIVKASGNYYVTTTNTLNCIKTSEQVAVKVNPVPSSSKTQVDVKCNGNATASIDLTVTGGTSGYTYLWEASNGGTIPSGQSTNQDITNLVSGKYNVTVTDANGCIAKDSGVISQPDKITKSKSISNVKCFNGNDGAIDETISGGITPFSFAWSNSATTEDISALTAGTYYLTVTDKNGCIIKDTATITQPSKLTKSHSITNVKCFGGSDGIIDLTISGGTTPYSYSWNNSATAQDLNGITAGTYNVLVTDSNDCIIHDTGTVNQPNQLAKSKNITQVKCFGGNDGKIDITISGGTTPYSYAWSNSATTEDISTLTAGIYTVVVTDKNNCTIKDTGTITQPSILSKSHTIQEFNFISKRVYKNDSIFTDNAIFCQSEHPECGVKFLKTGQNWFIYNGNRWNMFYSKKDNSLLKQNLLYCNSFLQPIMVLIKVNF